MATECYLTSLCLHYLTFECFDQDLSDDRCKEFLLDGSYAFQDYAVTHWSDHVRKVIEKGTSGFRSSTEDGEDEAGMVGSAVTHFVVHYELEPQVDAGGDQTIEKCLPFKNYSFYSDICYLFYHIQQHSAKGLRGLDEISPKPLEHSISLNRKILESYSDISNCDFNTRADLDLFYSRRWYKCSKVTCYYFHEGFPELNSRDYHVTRHEKPFRCRLEDCDMGHNLGFVTQRELDKHLSIYHPESGSRVNTFSRLKKNRQKREDSDSQSPSKSKHPAIFQCHLCPKRFTRKQALSDHLHAHSGEKPLQCRHCEQRFVRDSDRKRHEDRHRGEKKHICRGEVNGILGPKTWGCGKEFLRADALASHFRSEAARACRQPLLDEDERRKQWQSYIEERKVLGLDLPLPQQLYEQYPELKVVNPESMSTDLDDMFQIDSALESAESSMLLPGSSGSTMQEVLMPSVVMMPVDDEDCEMHV
jgi:hypothetical protein